MAGDDTQENRRRAFWQYRRSADALVMLALAVAAIAAGVTSVTVVTAERVYDCRVGPAPK